MADWIFLSPHLDDVILSCGGLIAEQLKAGKQIEIWTICAGKPPAKELPPFAETLHARWQTGPDAIVARRKEDKEACRILGVRSRHLDIPDCIYRRLPGGEPLINEEKDLNQPISPGEKPLVARLAQTLNNALPAHVPLVCPLTVGGHVDHRLTRAAAEALCRPLWFYADYPYIANDMSHLSSFIENSWRAFLQWITPEGLTAWQEAIKAYTSQISTFWGNTTEMNNAVEKYWRGGGGGTLWQPGA
jgi:LmbE family N-acetylglucosaminyl deacetylase